MKLNWEQHHFSEKFNDEQTRVWALQASPISLNDSGELDVGKVHAQAHREDSHSTAFNKMYWAILYAELANHDFYMKRC